MEETVGRIVAGSVVELVSSYGDSIPEGRRPRGVVKQLPGEKLDGNGFVLSDLVVETTLDDLQGFDFWPIDEVRLVTA